MRRKPFFSTSISEAGKQLGMERAQRSANPRWSALVDQLIVEVARTQPQFTTDNVYDKLYAMDERIRPDTHEHRAMGPRMRSAAERGICVLAGRTLKSNRSSRHRAPLQVWTSLIYGRVR